MIRQRLWGNDWIVINEAAIFDTPIPRKQCVECVGCQIIR